jgi:nucleosome assembly protein 1-like 1
MSVIIGDYEPTNQEADYPLVHGLSDEQQKMFDVENGGESDGDVRGVPHFWLTVLKHVDTCGEMIEEWDEPILEHLVDVSVDVYGGPKPVCCHRTIVFNGRKP